MILKLKSSFSSKKTDFFWNQVSAQLKVAQYAVRGQVPITAGLIRKEISENPNHGYPFQKTISCNIGNPQQFGQKPFTFNRQFLSCLLDPSRQKYLHYDLNNYARDNSLSKQLIEQHQHTLQDASRKASLLLKQIISVGSYTDSRGIVSIRQSIARFLAQKDETPQPHIDEIYLTNGASQALHIIFRSLLRSNQDSILIPIPQYPLYSAAAALYNGTLAPYYLSQEGGWQLEKSELESAINLTRKQGKNPKVIVVINPGNPTGAIFNESTIREIIQISVKNRLVVLADEVYRENIYKEGASFHSFRKVLNTMPKDIQQKCELISMHSVSKGLQGECGLRGGYMHLHNICSEVLKQIYKLSSICLCASTVGQSAVQCMVNPPKIGVQHPATVQLYQNQSAALLSSLKKRAKIVTKALREMKNINCNEIEGAMYAFPSIKFSEKAKAKAKEMGKEPDLFYCLEALKKTGIILVPGSGFKQRPNTYHFRITTLVNQEDLLKTLQKMHDFNEEFHNQYL